MAAHYSQSRAYEEAIRYFKEALSHAENDGKVKMVQITHTRKYTALLMLPDHARAGPTVHEDRRAGPVHEPVHDAAAQRPGERRGDRHDGRPQVPSQRLRRGHIPLPPAARPEARSLPRARQVSCTLLYCSYSLYETSDVAVTDSSTC